MPNNNIRAAMDAKIARYNRDYMASIEQNQNKK